MFEAGSACAPEMSEVCYVTCSLWAPFHTFDIVGASCVMRSLPKVLRSARWRASIIGVVETSRPTRPEQLRKQACSLLVNSIKVGKMASSVLIHLISKAAPIYMFRRLLNDKRFFSLLGFRLTCAGSPHSAFSGLHKVLIVAIV